MVFEYQILKFAQMWSLFASKMGCFSFSSQLGTGKEHLLQISKCLINFEITLSTKLNEYIKKYQKCVLQTVQISKLESFFLKISKTAGI